MASAWNAFVKDWMASHRPKTQAQAVAQMRAAAAAWRSKRGGKASPTPQKKRSKARTPRSSKGSGLTRLMKAPSRLPSVSTVRVINAKFIGAPEAKDPFAPLFPPPLRKIR